jgi:hypothetical protein
MHVMTRLGGTLAALVAAALVLAMAAGGQNGEPVTPTYRLLQKDVIVNADLWSKKPSMLAAGLGFTSIIGVPGLTTDDLAASEQLVREAGGTWNTISCPSGTTPTLAAYTSAATPQQVAFAYGSPTTNADGLPVEFSWPIRPSRLGAGDFQVVLNNGQVLTPQLASIYPNEEYNERSVVVLFGEFGNRLPPSDPGASYPVLTRVVRDSSPLQLVGPAGRLVSAVGMKAKSSGSPYSDPNLPPAKRKGPRLVGAKLSRMSAKGDNAPAPFRAALPNDGVTLYGKRARFRLRVYTTGGFSPDGVRAVFPTDFSRFFRLEAEGAGGHRVLIRKAGVDYRLGGGSVRVLGLADLGRKASSYDDCYGEDKDNYIDIVLSGDRTAADRITAVEIPVGGRHSPFYNPGGPGNNPTQGTRYTSPGPSQTIKVLDALEHPMTVTFVKRRSSR